MCQNRHDVAAKLVSGECWVFFYSMSYVAYWSVQEPKPTIKAAWSPGWKMVIDYLVWPSHKFDPNTKNCMRCGSPQM